MTEPAGVPARERRARLANMRQELLAPVTALVGYGQLLSGWLWVISRPTSSGFCRPRKICLG